MEVNDDGKIKLTLGEFEDQHANLLEAALQSENLGDLIMILRNYDGQTHLDLFRRAIANALGTVALVGRAADPAVLVPFLTDIVLNSNIQSVVLLDLTFSAASLASLFRVSKSVKALKIQNCLVAETTGTWEAGVERALNDNNVIEQVVIGVSDTEYLERVIMHLANRPSLRRLTFIKTSALVPERGTASLHMASVIRNLLLGGQTALIVKCTRLEFEEANFRPIANGAVNGNSTMSLVFAECSFNGKATELFETMFQPGSNLRKFGFDDPTTSFSKPMDAMMKSILQQNSPLLTLVVSELDAEGGEGLITAIMKELTVNTTLQFLYITDSTLHPISEEIFDIVTRGIPKFRGVKFLSIHANLQMNDAQRPALMDSLKRNHTIWRNDGVRHVFPNPRDHRILGHLETRNQKIADFLKHPATIPPYLLPKLFRLVQECEYGPRIICRLMPEPDELDDPESSADSVDLQSSIDGENLNVDQSGSH